MIDVTREPDRDFVSESGDRSRYWFSERKLPGGSCAQYLNLTEADASVYRRMRLIDNEQPRAAVPRSKRVKRGRILKVALQLQRGLV